MRDGTKFRASRERAKELRKLHYLYTFDRDAIFDDSVLYYSPELDDKPLTTEEIKHELKTEDGSKTPQKRWWKI